MSVKRLNDDVETVKEFCYAENTQSASGGSEMKAQHKQESYAILRS